MGRAYEVRKASIQKTGALKAKLYSMYAREIYAAAKAGGVETSSNPALKRLTEKAKKDQVPSDIIKRAIDKVHSGADESYFASTYELFGPGSSTLIVECLTDNVNRTISDLRAALNKCHCKMGAMGSVSYLYDHLAVLSTSAFSEEEAIDLFIENEIDITDIEKEEENVIIYGQPKDLLSMKGALCKEKDVTFDMDDVIYLPKEKVSLEKKDEEVFEKLFAMLEEIEDVQHIYHNVSLSS